MQKNFANDHLACHNCVMMPDFLHTKGLNLFEHGGMLLMICWREMVGRGFHVARKSFQVEPLSRTPINVTPIMDHVIEGWAVVRDTLGTDHK
jgi:hypothetical protein